MYQKPIPLSPLVALDRERCVLCARCTRFCDQISGDRFIELFDRGAAEQVSIAPGEDFRLLGHNLGGAPYIPLVGVLRGDPQGSLLAPAADEQRQVRPDGLGIARSVDQAVVGALEARALVVEQ